MMHFDVNFNDIPFGISSNGYSCGVSTRYTEHSRNDESAQEIHVDEKSWSSVGGKTLIVLK